MGWVIPREGDGQKLKNYRSMTLTETFIRLYGRIQRNLIEQEYGHRKAKEKCAFQVGRS